MRHLPLSQKSFTSSTAFNGGGSEKSTTRFSIREHLNWERTVLSRAQVGTSTQATSICCSQHVSATKPVSCEKPPSEKKMPRSLTSIWNAFYLSTITTIT